MAAVRPPRALPRYREIYQRIRASVEDGVLRPGDRIASARTLAVEFNVARGTVDTALALLAGEGFIVARSRRGAVVSPTLPAAAARPAAQARRRSRPAIAPPPYQYMYKDPLPLRPGLPGLDLFPRKLWSQLVARHARRSQPAQLSYQDPLGSMELRTAIAAYLTVARGVACAPEEVIITGGFVGGLALVLRAMTMPGAQAWVERPGFRFTERAVFASGVRPVDVPVDEEGIDVAAGVAAAPNATLAVVAPANQYPLNVSLSLRRRMALLDWAQSCGGWVVEDDYSGEFRYDGWPLPSLKSLDRDDRVFYIGTFSKTLFPSLRLGYMVAPASQYARLRELVQLVESGRPALEQAVLAEFIADGHFARHIKRMRSAYRARGAALAAALDEVFQGRFSTRPTAGGLHLIADLVGDPDDVVLARAATAGGLGPAALSPMMPADDRRRALILGFGHVPEDQALAITRRLQSLLPPAAQPRRAAG